MCDWQAFLLPPLKLFGAVSLSTLLRQKTQPGLETSTVQCLSFWPWVSHYHVRGMNVLDCQSSTWTHTTRHVKLPCLSGSGGRLVWVQPCCFMRLVTEQQVRTSLILMCNNSSENHTENKWHILKIGDFCCKCEMATSLSASGQLCRRRVSDLKSHILHSDTLSCSGMGCSIHISLRIRSLGKTNNCLFVPITNCPVCVCVCVCVWQRAHLLLSTNQKEKNVI